MNWKDFFYFSRRERRGLIVLLVLLIGVFLGKFLFEEREPDPIEQLVDQTTETVRSNSSAVSYSSTTEVAASEPAKRGSRSAKPQSNFNQTRSKPEPVAENPTRTYYAREKSESSEKRSQSSFPKPEKLEAGTKLDLNSADSLLLCKVPGIGAAFSGRIISYRNLLGGYTRMEQLQEVYGMYEELYEKIIPFFEINTDSLRKIPINTASLDRLRAHPYLNFYQAKAILEIRKKSGRLDGITQLELLEEFTEEDMEKIEPYLSFDF